MPTAPLREALTVAGFERVATYINSGNAVLATHLGVDEVVARVAEICKQRFDFAKAVYAIPLEIWEEQIIAANPFPTKTEPGNLLHAAWLAEQPSATNLAALRALAVDGDLFEVVGNVAYFHTPGGFSRSALALRFDRGIAVANTARNWNTVLKLRDLAQKAA